MLKVSNVDFVYSAFSADNPMLVGSDGGLDMPSWISRSSSNAAPAVAMPSTAGLGFSSIPMTKAQSTISKAHSTISRSMTISRTSSFNGTIPANAPQLERVGSMSQVGWAATLRTNLLSAINNMTRSSTRQSETSLTDALPIYNRPAHSASTPYITEETPKEKVDHPTSYEQPSKGIKLYIHRTSGGFRSSGSGDSSEEEGKAFRVKVEDPYLSAYLEAKGSNLEQYIAEAPSRPLSPITRSSTQSSSSGWYRSVDERTMPALRRADSSDNESMYSSATGISKTSFKPTAVERIAMPQIPLPTLLKTPRTAKPPRHLRNKQIRKALTPHPEESSAGSESELGSPANWFLRERPVLPPL